MKKWVKVSLEWNPFIVILGFYMAANAIVYLYVSWRAGFWMFFGGAS